MPRIAILGASGLVGRTMLGLLEDRAWVREDPLLLVSSRSAGKSLPFRGRSLECVEAAGGCLEGVGIALFSAGAGPSGRFGPEGAAGGAWVIDNSSAFRRDPRVPLVVPEVNAAAIPADKAGIIANPNCSTIQIAMAAAPLAAAFGLREVHVTTFQAVSGAGAAAVAELRGQIDGRRPEAGPVFGRPIAGNVLPAIGSPLEDGSYTEEDKVVFELRKILGRGEDLHVTCTAVRVPVVNGHSAAVRFVLDREAEPAAAVAALSRWPGLVVAPGPHDFASPLEADGRTEVFVGRVRRDPGCRTGLLAWVVADNLLKGAAWNAVQIADLLVARTGGERR